MSTYIRSTRHALKFSNQGKLQKLSSFIQEYRRVAQLYLDYLWNNPQCHIIKDKEIEFDAKTKWNMPSYLSRIEINEKLNLKTTLSARALACCLTQVLSLIIGTVKKQKDRQFVINKLRAKSKKIPHKLRKRTRNSKPSKPDVSNLNPELNSVCANLQDRESKEFNAFIQLCSYTNKKRGLTTNFPIKYTQVDNKWNSKGNKLNSFLFNTNFIEIRYEINTENQESRKTAKKERKKNKQTRKQKKTKIIENNKKVIVGADQGKTTVLTLSNNHSTNEVKDIHNHTLTSIIDKLSRKKRGSKSFRQAQYHRKNFINWSINQLDFSNIDELRLEDLAWRNYKNSQIRKLRHWTHRDIENKLILKCEEEEVLLSLQSSVYRSQRCSCCGLVCKSNRKGKVYHCKNCGLKMDSDFNASINHQHDLPIIPWGLQRLNLNRKGFFWKPDGIFKLTGEEFTVPLSKNELIT